MRYTIGATIIDKRTKEEYSGYYASGRFGLTSILGEEEIPKLIEKCTLKNYSIYVFDKLEDAEHFCRCLSRAYRRDDVWGNNKLKSRKIRRFYPLKVDSSKFHLELDDKVSFGKLSKDIYNKDSNVTINLPSRTIIGLKK